MKRIPYKRVIGWQAFRRTGWVDHWTESGRHIQMVRYEALCADCGAPFTAMAAKTFWRLSKLRRRCDRHRNAGLRVDNSAPPVRVSEMPLWARPPRKPRSPIKAKRIRRDPPALNQPSYLD